MSKLPIALTIAGTDPSGGAGVMADLKSFQSRGVYGMAAITSVVAQNTLGVQKICNLDLEIFEAQLKSVFDDIPPYALKTGMIPTLEHMEVIEKYLSKEIPYVLDPVMIATSGDRLIDEKAQTALEQKLLSKATIVTPNIPETQEIVGFNVVTEEDIDRAGKIILNEFGSESVLIKGGHLETATDYLYIKDGTKKVFTSEKFQTKHTHGTGCTLSAVITAELAKGKSIEEAVIIGKKFITEAIKYTPELGHGNGPVNHFAYKD